MSPLSGTYIIVVFYIVSTRCYREKKADLLQAKVGEGECKGDENAWIKPFVMGYFVGLFLGVAVGVALCIAFVHHCILKNLIFQS